MKKLLLLALVLPYFIACQTLKSPSTMTTKTIDANWIFKEINGTHTGTATVPGTIHTDLIANGSIKDPFYRTNEKQQQWIDKKDWEYSTVLNITPVEFEKNNIVLTFKGLDTYADVFLNDSLILQADNMFRTWEVNIKPFVKNGDNTLKVLLHSPIKKGLELLAASPYAYPAINDQSENGGLGDKKVSVFTRKAGYHYGWDWGPRLVTSGIWRPVVLQAWNDIRINDVFVKQPKITAEVAELIFDIELQMDEAFSGSIQILDKNTQTLYASLNYDFLAGVQKMVLPLTIENPKLWWSKGLGEANMYNFSIEVFDNEQNNICKKEISTGLRSVKLIREKDAIGESFLFELNGVRVFMKGANYIPNDNFLPRVTKNDYQKVIKDAVDANMNMLRVWGGGIYEDDYFYQLCDENGLLVWQDFMFACSMYPGGEDFLNSIKHEAIDNVKRLRNHPSIALWCGNNEINTAWHHYAEGGWGWKELYTPEQQKEIQNSYLTIFHDILPDVVENYTDGDDYWPSSPQAGFEPEKHAGYENTSGDMHYWGVWHGQHPFEDFEKYKARFMSEYGFQSFPDFETVKKYAVPEDFNIESEVMASHQRSGIGNLRIKEYMGLYYNTPDDFENFLYMSQVLQSRALKMAIEAHRGAMPYCMGTLYWQINDCWPVASWSSTDYYHNWKAAHYTIKKAYEPVLITVKADADNMVINGISDLLNDTKGTLELVLLDFNGSVISSDSMPINLLKNTSTKLHEVKRVELLGEADPKSIVLKVTFTAEDGFSSSNLYYFEKPKDLKLDKPTVKTEIVENNGEKSLKITTDKLVRDLYINFPNQTVFLSDNYFDLLPNEIKWIEVSSQTALDINDLKIKYVK